jgi:putative membrane protein
MAIVINWIVATVAVIVSAYLLPGVHVSNLVAAFVAAVVLGVINAFVRPVLLALTLPINVVTLGLFTFVLNALLIMFAGAIVPGFGVDNFWWALAFSIVLTLVNAVLGSLKSEKN